MSEPTIEEMKTVLRDAGAKVKANATDEEIWLAHEELQAGAAPALEPIIEAPAPMEKTSTSKETLEDILRRANPQMGDKDPMVVAWCKENLTEEEFDARYAGRRFDRA